MLVLSCTNSWSYYDRTCVKYIFFCILRVIKKSYDFVALTIRDLFLSQPRFVRLFMIRFLYFRQQVKAALTPRQPLSLLSWLAQKKKAGCGRTRPICPPPWPPSRLRRRRSWTVVVPPSFSLSLSECAPRAATRNTKLLHSVGFKLTPITIILIMV